MTSNHWPDAADHSACAIPPEEPVSRIPISAVELHRGHTTSTSTRMVAVSLSDKLAAREAHPSLHKMALSALPALRPRIKDEESKMIWDAAVEDALERLGDEEFFRSPPPTARDHGGMRSATACRARRAHRGAVGAHAPAHAAAHHGSPGAPTSREEPLPCAPVLQPNHVPYERNRRRQRREALE